MLERLRFLSRFPAPTNGCDNAVRMADDRTWTPSASRRRRRARLTAGFGWAGFCSLALLTLGLGCRPMAGTTSPGFNSRLGMGPQNRSLGNAAFNSVGYGESAYGRVAYGPGVTIPGLISPNGTTVAGGPDGGTTIQWDLGAEQANSTTPATTPIPPLDAAYAKQLERLNSDNTELYRQLATVQQELRQTLDKNQNLEQQLAMARSQAEQLERMSQNAQQQLEVMQASSSNPTGFRGATLRGNNSLTQHVDQLRIPGTQAIAEGQVVRVIVPTELLFQPGTTQFQASGASVVQAFASAIKQYYPGQIIGIEAHWDDTATTGTPIGPHETTSNQALAIMNYLTAQNLLPAQQLLVMGYGANRPRFSNATPEGRAANRRIELVVYPDRY